MSETTLGSSGSSTDAKGNPVVDPTANVLALVAAGNARQDDLRAMEAAHVRELIQMRATEREREIAGLRSIDSLRALHSRDLREAEAARIDAIRAVDVGAVQQAAEVQATQATTLAAQVATSAETLRTQVAAAASAATIALAAALEPVQKDIADLRRAQYEAQGVKAQTTEGGSVGRAWLGIAIAFAAVASSVLLAAAGIVITLLLK